MNFSRVILLTLSLSFSVLTGFVNHAFATSGACSGHSGVNCSAGSDWDGSVICYDGWTGSSVSYSSMVMCSGYSYSESAAPTTSTIPACQAHASYFLGTCICDKAYAKSLDGLSCVSIPKNARLAIGSTTDVWVCVTGYHEVGNTCVKDEEETDATKEEQGEESGDLVETPTSTQDSSGEGVVVGLLHVVVIFGGGFVLRKILKR